MLSIERRHGPRVEAANELRRQGPRQTVVVHEEAAGRRQTPRKGTRQLIVAQVHRPLRDGSRLDGLRYRARQAVPLQQEHRQWRWHLLLRGAPRIEEGTGYGTGEAVHGKVEKSEVGK